MAIITSVQSHVNGTTATSEVAFTTLAPEIVTADEPFAEPVPNWTIAKQEWGVAWEIHIYSLGALFSILAIMSFVNIIRLCLLRNLLSKPYFMSLNVLIFIASVLRAVYMFVDAYNSNGVFHNAFAYFFTSITLPCFTSAFYILFAALIKVTKFKIASAKIYNVRVLIGIIVFNFVLSIAADVITGFFFEARYLLVICQSTYVFLGFLFSIAYMVLFRRMYQTTISNRNEIRRMSNHGKNVKNAQVPRKVSLAIKITLVSAILFFIWTVLNVFGVASQMGILTTETPEPWAWWGYHLGTRLCEVYLGFTIVLVASQPFKKKKSRQSFSSNSGTQLVRQSTQDSFASKTSSKQNQQVEKY